MSSKATNLPVEHRLQSLLEEALSEARAEIARREEVERKLERVRIEAASLAIELNRLERDYDAAALQSEGQLKQLRADAQAARAEAERAQKELAAARQLPARLAPPPQPVADEPSGEPIVPRGRRERPKRMFGARGRTCAVCRRTEAAGPGALKAGGWALGSEIDLCPDCQEQGWQVPKGGSLPFRRSSERQRSS